MKISLTKLSRVVVVPALLKTSERAKLKALLPKPFQFSFICSRYGIGLGAQHGCERQSLLEKMAANSFNVSITFAGLLGQKQRVILQNAAC